MTTISAVVTAILAALAVNLGTFDLSATDQVQEGTFTTPPGSVAFAGVCPAVQGAAVQQAAGVYYLEDYSIKVRLWGPVTAGTTANRASRGRTLGSEAKVKIDAARDTGGNALWKCIRFACTQNEPDPAALAAAPGWAMAELTLTLTLRRGTQT